MYPTSADPASPSVVANGLLLSPRYAALPRQHSAVGRMRDYDISKQRVLGQVLPRSAIDLLLVQLVIRTDSGVRCPRVVRLHPRRAPSAAPQRRRGHGPLRCGAPRSQAQSGRYRPARARHRRQQLPTPLHAQLSAAPRSTLGMPRLICTAVCHCRSDRQSWLSVSSILVWSHRDASFSSAPAVAPRRHRQHPAVPSCRHPRKVR